MDCMMRSDLMMTAVMDMIFLLHVGAMQRVKPPDVMDGCCGGCREVVVSGVGAGDGNLGGVGVVSGVRWVWGY